MEFFTSGILHVLWIFLGEQRTDFGTATYYFCGIPLYFDVQTTVTSQTPLFEME